MVRPVASIFFAPAGGLICAPTAAIFPSWTTMLPRSMMGDETGTIRALVRMKVSAHRGATNRATRALFMANLLCRRRRRTARLRLGLELLFPGDALRQVTGAVEKDLAVDDRFFHACVGAEGMSVEDGQIGILARFEGPDTAVNAEHPGGIDSDQAQGLGFAEAAVFHGFRRLAVE